MKLLFSTLGKIILLLLITILLFIGWQAGLETAYAKVVVATTNFSLGIFTEDTHIEYVKTADKSKYEFVVYTRIDGRKGHYPQEPGGMLQPFVIILSWQIFLFFILKRRSAFRALGLNFLIFILFQILFLVFLTNYYTSPWQQFLFTMMMDSFYIIALVLVIKDAMLYPVFKKKVVKSQK